MPEDDFEVQMDIVNMLSTTYLHNRISAFGNIIPPYNELKYMQMKKKHMKKINSLSVLQVEKRENLMFKMRKDIFTEKIYSVTDYLKKEKFLMINI